MPTIVDNSGPQTNSFDFSSTSISPSFLAETFIAGDNYLNNVTITAVQNQSTNPFSFQLLITTNASANSAGFRPGNVLYESPLVTVAGGQNGPISFDIGNLQLSSGNQYAFILDNLDGGNQSNYLANVGANTSYPNGGAFLSTNHISRASAFSTDFGAAGAPNSDLRFSLTFNNTNSASPAPCYVSGTRIRVLRGLNIQDVPVEHLRLGDTVITASGMPRPIRWIGTRAYPGLTAPKHDRPVRIRAGALADCVPARDLLVSPDHCLWLDGLLVAAGHLVNGTSITRGEAVRDLTYWHVELDTHDMLLAENTPAESFLAAPGVRAGFDGVEADDTAPAPVPYALRTEHGPALDALRERLILRAGLSTEPTRFGAVRAWMDRCDGIRIAGWAQDAEHPDGPMCLDIVVDGAVVAMTLAEEYRADIAAAGIGDGRHGFDLELDEPLTPGTVHTVEVRRSADGLRICAMAVDAVGAWTPLLAA